MAVHSIVPLSAMQTAEREVWTETLEGKVDEIIAAANSYAVGDKVALDNPSIGGYQEQAVYTALRMMRKEGGLAELTYSYTYIRKYEQWSLDMAEITKDIRTWLVTEKGGMSQSEASVALAKIAQWEAYKNAGDYVRWENFQYNDDGDKLTGNALVLAEKIMKGIQTYSIYAPVITRTTQWVSTPPLENVGKIETPTVRAGWEILGGDPAWASSANSWLKTACRSTPNGDGTYTLVEQWTGADDIDGDLYANATSVTPEVPDAV